MEDQKIKWHQLDATSTLKQLHTSASSGLSRREARLRLRKQGRNTLFDVRTRVDRSLLKSLFTDPAILLLLFSAILAMMFSNFWEGFVTLLCAFVGIGFAVRIHLVERRTLHEIHKTTLPKVRVLRDGRVLSVRASGVVRGDILVLGAGDVLPADCRLLAISENCSILTLYPNEKGVATRTCYPKNPARVYAVGEVAVAPNLENMLYGGSEVTSGEAIAVVVEVSSHTYIGAQKLFLLPAAFHADETASATSALHPYLRFYAFLLFAALIPLAVVGMLTYSRARSLISIFSTLAAMTAAGATALLAFRFQSTRVFLQKRFFTEKHRENRAVLRNIGNADTVADLTDLFVLGHTGISDVRWHLQSVATGNGVILPTNEQAGESLSPICEATLLLKRAEDKQDTLCAALPPTATLMRELKDLTAFDAEALDVRLSDLFAEVNGRGEVLLRADLHNGGYTLLFSSDPTRVSKCEFYESNGKMRYLEPVSRKHLSDFTTAARNAACRTLTILKKTDEQWALLGVIALCEQPQEMLPSVIEELEMSGVRVHVCLREESDFERAYAATAGLSKEIMTKSEATALGLEMSDLIGKYRVFLGFSPSEIAQTVRNVRRGGGCVAVLGSASDDLPVLHAASLGIASEVAEESTAVLAETVRYHADLLVQPPIRTGGGLYTLLCLISSIRAYHHRVPLVFGFSATAQLALVAATVLSTIFGVGLMNASQILYLGMLAEYLFAASLFTLPIPQSVLRTSHPIDGTELKHTILRRDFWWGAISVVPLLLLLWIFKLCGLVTAELATPCIFTSLSFLQIVAFLKTIRQKQLRQKIRKTTFMLSLVMLPVRLASALALLLPALDSFLMMGRWNLYTLLLVPLTPLLFFAFSFFFKRTAN